MNFAGLYKPREPEKTDLYKIVFNYYEEYEQVYTDRYESEFGYIRKRVIEVVHKFLDCGILEQNPVSMPLLYPEEKTGMDRLGNESCS